MFSVRRIFTKTANDLSWVLCIKYVTILYPQYAISSVIKMIFLYLSYCYIHTIFVIAGLNVSNAFHEFFPVISISSMKIVTLSIPLKDCSIVLCELPGEFVRLIDNFNKWNKPFGTFIVSNSCDSSSIDNCRYVYLKAIIAKCKQSLM